MSGIDYSNFDDAAVKKVEKALKGLEVGVLINNVGVSYEFPMYFDELSDEQVRAISASCHLDDWGPTHFKIPKFQLNPPPLPKTHAHIGALPPGAQRGLHDVHDPRGAPRHGGAQEGRHRQPSLGGLPQPVPAPLHVLGRQVLHRGSCNRRFGCCAYRGNASEC